MAIKGTPWAPRPTEAEKKDPEIYFPEEVTEEGPPTQYAEGDLAKPRRVKITVKDLRKYGYTNGCLKCSELRRGLKTEKGHTETCRRRLEAAMRDDEEDQRRVREAGNRMDRYMYESTRGAAEEGKQHWGRAGHIATHRRRTTSRPSYASTRSSSTSP